MKYEIFVEKEQEKKKILKVLDRFIEGLKTKDSKIWQDIFMDEGAHFAFRKTDEGDWRPNYRKPGEWLSILVIEGRDLDQNFWNPQVRIRGPIAHVWSPYELIRGNEWSHCGIDSFALLKIKGHWKIFSMVFTQEPEFDDELKKS